MTATRVRSAGSKTGTGFQRRQDPLDGKVTEEVPRRLPTSTERNAAACCPPRAARRRSGHGPGSVTQEKCPLRDAVRPDPAAVAVAAHTSWPALCSPLLWLKPKEKVYVPGLNVMPGLSVTT